MVVNGNNVTASGLAVEHFQQYETIWNGQGVFYIPSGVTSFTGYGMAFQAPVPVTS
jgi:hypothetical protein